MKFVVLVNPVSGKRRSVEILSSINPQFQSAGASTLVIETEFSGHAKELAATLDIGEYDGLIVLGGDGTFHEVVNGMLARQDGKKIPLGIVPSGSGNSLTYDLGLIDPIKAAKAIMRGETTFLDVARVEINNMVLHSINLIGWGLVTDVGEMAEWLRWLGPSRYTISSVIEIFRKRDRRATLVIDNKEIIDDFTFIVGCNSIHIGKGMRMAPYASLDDGLIDLIVVRANITRRRLLSVLPKLFNGTHINEPEVEYYQVSTFSLKSETSDTLNVDGELVGNTPITVNMIQKAVEIFGCHASLQ
jgi:YegS/Rv2252/BmrU family lipid kinase